MQYNFVIIRTNKGRKYARKILNSVKWLNENKYPQHEFRVFNWTINEFLGFFPDIRHEIFNEERTIIHARCANPRTEWTIKLRELEEMGYKVVNSVDTIELTSNKLACSLALQDKVNHPKSWEYSRNMGDGQFKSLWDEIMDELGFPEFIIAKPLTSLEQGANVRKIPCRIINYRYGNFRDEINQVPGNKIVIQEYIPYTALHRVIVIGGKALPYTFVDYANDPRKTDWKVSCCLNTTTMKIDTNPVIQVLELAEKTQKEVGGIINFIDIFEYETNTDMGYGEIDTGFTISEINTACSLNIHERLARNANRHDWNIHSKIAKELVHQILHD